jgi:hypothetical protein
MRLSSSIIEVQQLTSKERQSMFDLMQQCYENIHRDKFEEDLDAKWSVIQVHDPANDRLVGFSTQVMLEASVDYKSITALFSGDTVVQPSHWGDPALAHEWGQLALRLIDQHPPGKLYWFLTSKGFRTYRYLPLFFRQYFPCVGEELEHDHSAAVDALGQMIGGQRYDSTRQVILSTPDKDYVRWDISDPNARKNNDPHVRFFLERNPGCVHGDELCCIAPLSRQNFTRAAYRVINARAADREAI